LKIAAAETNVDIQKAAVSSAQAALDLKVAGPRAVDVAPLRAQLQEANVSLAQAENNLNNVRILAPVDGTITDVISDVGEQITPNVAQIRMIGTEVYDIEAQVPEADIVKVQVGQEAEITLDSYGDEIKFKGVVTAENPDQTKVLDAIYYKIRVALEKTDRDIKPGMTANVIVTTNVADNAFVIPVRAVKTDAETGAKSVRILVDNQPETKQIELGLRGDEGRVQVLHGLSVGQAVILSEKIGK
nr:efflux RND transporter periplasmic adaptor subunit [bacterium]